MERSENERQIRYLDRVIARGRLAHAYLFYGPDIAAQLEIAKALARSLRCPNSRAETSILNAGDGCGECAAIDADLHPHVVLLDLAHTLTSDKEERKDIPVDDIRELRRIFALSVPDGRWRVAILNRIDTMSKAAADAFLKLLEEPGERTLFLLISAAREIVPPTIVSRAIPMRFSGGGGAKSPADDKIRAAIRAAYGRGIAGVLAFTERRAQDREARLSAADALVGMLRARVLAAADSRERLEAARRLERVLDIAADLETVNVNPRLALDVMFLESGVCFRDLLEVK